MSSPAREITAVFWYNYLPDGQGENLGRSGLPWRSCLPLPSRDCYPGELVLAIPHPFMFSGVFCPYCPKDHPQ